MERRLAAILVADVVGYSRLMGLDEAGTLLVLKARQRNVIAPLIQKHRGRIVNLVGDSVLAEFGSAVNAVECAAALQREMDVANRGIRADQRIVLRIGVNIGDVVVEGDDLYGDGINVAARLQALADPGSVFVSQAVFGQIRAKVPLTFDDLGEHALKPTPASQRIMDTGMRRRVEMMAAPRAINPSALSTTCNTGIAVSP